MAKKELMLMKKQHKQFETWADFTKYQSTLSKKEKGDSFEFLTKQFLKLDPVYATKLKHVWLLNEVPSKVRKELNLTEKDLGIDIIAETKLGDYWAVQCKYREDENHALTWRELSTFTGLALGVSKNVTFALVAYNGDRITKVLTEADRVGFITSETWHRLDSDFFARAFVPPSQTAPKLKPYLPRPYQERAISNAAKHYKRESRGKLIMACGTGKSLTAYWIARELRSRTILVAVPSLWLMRQTIGVWLRELVAEGKANGVEWLCVCSDQTVSENRNDDVALHTQDLGIPATTSITAVAQWAKESDPKKFRIIFTTYQSGEVLSAGLKNSDLHFDIGIMDEAHKTVGVKDKRFSRLLFDENVQVKQRVFMTATERRFAGKGDTILSMDDPAVYGETFEQLSFKEALEAKPTVLSDYKIITAVVTDKDIHEIIDRNKYVRPESGKWDDEMEAQSLVALIALRKAMQRYPIKHAVSFHGSIARAVAFKENNDLLTGEHSDFGVLDTFHVQGKTSTSARDHIIRDFITSDRALITNARCLTEGVDVPNIDCVLFADPKNSTVDIVQAVGRALRPAKNKEYGYVIVPVIGRSADADELITDRAFDQVIRVLSALAASDDRIIEYFRAISEKRPVKGKNVSIEIDVIAATKIDLEKFSEKVSLRIWNRLAKISWRPFNEAREFARSLKLKNAAEWELYSKGNFPQYSPRPMDIPSAPYMSYKNQGWAGWGNWLGNGNKPIVRGGTWRPFKEAREFARSLKLKGQVEWRQYCKGELLGHRPRPMDIPSSPYEPYKNQGWAGMGDWLGNGNKRKSAIWRPFGIWQPFKEAREFARSLKLKGQVEWKQYCKGKILGHKPRPVGIPSHPDRTFKEEWNGWSDWLGKTKFKRK